MGPGQPPSSSIPSPESSTKSGRLTTRKADRALCVATSMTEVLWISSQIHRDLLHLDVGHAQVVPSRGVLVSVAGNERDSSAHGPSFAVF
jgi:hypothetical protein